MRLRSFFIRSAGSVILALAAAQSWAGHMGLIKLTGQVGFSCWTGNGGFEQSCPTGDHVEKGTFSLIYDPSITDTDAGTNSGLFRGAITSFVMTVSQVNRPELRFSLVGRGDFRREFDADGMGQDWMSWKMMLDEEHGAVERSLFSFDMVPQTWEDPNGMPSTDFWSAVTGLGAGGAGVHETDWLYGGSLNVEVIPSPVPVPGSRWLMLIGAGGVLAQRLRRRN
ncbi:MAG: hypothetical protein AB1437_14370 [Pseudomonadota bacterium]